MDASSKSPARRLFYTLAAVGTVTLAAVALLLFRTRSTLVELQAVVDRFECTVLPPAADIAGGTPPAALARLHLLSPDLLVQSLDLRGARRLDAFLQGRGPTDVRFEAEGRLHLSTALPFQPVLSTFGPTHIIVEPSGRDRSGGARLRLTLPGFPAGSEPWTLTVPALTGLSLTAGREALTVPADAPDLLVTGGPAEARVGLSLPPPSKPSTLLRVIDPATGSASTFPLAFASAAPRALAWRDRLVLLEPQPGGTGPVPVLRPRLDILRPAFFHLERLEAQSALLGGTVRFPSGEKEPVELEPGFLLTLAATEPLTLRSITLDAGRLHLTLWGRAESLRLGPTPELQTELLPSLFVWLYTHKLRALIYSTLASILGLSLAVIKVFGLFKE